MNFTLFFLSKIWHTLMSWSSCSWISRKSSAVSRRVPKSACRLRVAWPICRSQVCNCKTHKYYPIMTLTERQKNLQLFPTNCFCAYPKYSMAISAHVPFKSTSFPHWLSVKCLEKLNNFSTYKPCFFSC